MNNTPAEQSDIRAYIRPVLKRWWLILAVVPVVTIGTYLYYDHKPKVYSASSELFVQPSTIDQVLLEGGPQYTSEATIENFALLIQTNAVSERAQKLIAKSPVTVPSGSVSAQALEKSNFIIVTGTASTPQGAAIIANAYTKAFVETQEIQHRGETNQTIRIAEKQLSQLGHNFEDETKRETLEEKIQTLELVASQSVGSSGVKVVERAFPSAVPVGHDPTSNAIFAFVLSLMLSIGAAFGLEYLTRKFTSVEDVEEAFDAPVLTEIPSVEVPAPFSTDGASITKELHEPFHRLQMNLDMLSTEARPLRTILIASAAPGEGKSVVTRNLALAYREAGRNVAVLDADFRKGTLGGLLEAHQGPGLTDVLAGRASFGEAVQEVTVNASTNGNGTGRHVGVAPAGVGEVTQGTLAMVPSGAHTANLAAELASTGLSEAVGTASQLYDRVILDSSPLLAAADVLPLLSQVDGVLLVTRLGVSTRDSAKRMIAELRRVPGINIVGVVVNGIPSRIYRTRAYGYYYG